MKPVHFKVPKIQNESILIQVDRESYFYDFLHFHEEIQLSCIVSGEGTRFVGDSIDSFSPGDVYLLGTNLPHVFRCDPEYYKKDSELMAHDILVFFNKETFGSEFISIPEMKEINYLIELSQRGLLITGETGIKIAQELQNIEKLGGFERLMKLLSMLQLIAQSGEYEQISNIGYSKPQKALHSKRLNDIFDFLMEHFHEEIKLEDVASVANMTPTAFCRFFKHRTKKTFSLFLNELRVSHACKILMEEDVSISEAAYRCGYNNISNFNRQFKAIKECTPKEFTERYKIAQ